jgi:putative flippase GtrA
VTLTPASKSTALAAAIAWIRAPDADLIGLGMRFAITGVTVALVSLGATITLAQGVGLPFEAAFAIGYSIAIATHFTLQRVFVWTHHTGFALPLRHQIARYLPVALTNYALVALAIAVLPQLLHVASLVVYLGATAIVTVVSFLLFRAHVFHADLGTAGPQ